MIGSPFRRARRSSLSLSKTSDLLDRITTLVVPRHRSDGISSVPPAIAVRQRYATRW